VIRTLLGAVPAEALGWTYVHEHVLTGPPAWRAEEDPDFVLDSPDGSLEEIERFRRAGGSTIVDATARDYGRDARALLAIARRTSVHIVAVTGWNRGDYGEEALGAGEDELLEIMLGDLRHGMDGTEARAGVAKLGTSDGTILPVELRIARAVGRVQAETGCPVITHTTRGTMAREQLDLLAEGGADMSKVALSHMDQSLDFVLLDELCARGASVIFDGCSKTKYAPDSARIAMLSRLVDAGHAERLLVSGDMGRRSYLRSYGGGPGFEYILGEFVPRLRVEGFPEELIETIFVTNPARWLDWPIA
jgi:predicted metal-dependent phosphotriesterase family hydrolase